MDYLPRGFSGLANFGWKHFEGKHIYDAEHPLLTTGHYVPPIVEYPHSVGLRRLGGFVYRGRRSRRRRAVLLRRQLLRNVWSLKVVNGQATYVRVEPFKVPGLSGFGEDSRRRALSHVGQLRRPLSA